MTTMPPIPAETPISGPFWTLIVPALLFAIAFIATWLLYRRFSQES
jgi:TRAP-type C4-dicarboxylate transport system permease large subunit